MENKNREKLLSKIDELIILVKESNDYKRYLELKKAMEKNNDIMSLINKVKKIEQLIINKEYRKEDTKKEKVELTSLNDELNSYPIYQEYNYLQKDIDSTLQTIKSIIEDSINKINS